MSNRARIEPTEFVAARTGEKTYGVRVLDDFAQVYDNAWEFIPDDDMEVLRLTINIGNQAIDGILDNCREHKKGLYIGSTYYNYEEIKEHLSRRP